MVCNYDRARRAVPFSGPVSRNVYAESALPEDPEPPKLKAHFRGHNPGYAPPCAGVFIFLPVAAFLVNCNSGRLSRIA
jgi:hypothetical protein